MELTKLTAASLIQFFSGGCSFLTANKDSVDALNVFPVPDGDTGTNMSLTMNSAVKDIAGLNTVPEVAGAVSTGALMGARGNSGVILSQLFRGFAQGVGNKKILSADDFAYALQKGVELAYKSVMKPVEGTILTVSKAVAAGCIQKAKTTKDIKEVMAFALYEGQKALDNTPNQLSVLKQAGVVDAGGKGFLMIFEGGLKGILGELVFNQVAVPAKPVFEEKARDLKDITFQYCTEVIIKGDNLPLEEIKSFLVDKGDSLLVVGTEQLIKIHVHTNHPGVVLERAVSYGTLHDIKIDNMKEQHRETLDLHEETDVIDCAVVAVAAGEGLAQIFSSLGAAKIISGGQTMNPSAEDLVKAINSVRAKQVIILPNNSNIVLTAQQAQSLAEKPVGVVPTKSLAEGMAAMLAFEEAQPLEDNVDKMVKAFAHVKTGEVTFAVRASSYNGLEIKEDDILGLFNGEIKVLGQDVNEVVQKLVGLMVGPNDELITLFFGNNVGEEEAEMLSEKIADSFPDLEVEIHYGGQPLYYYLISIE
ncbi:MAG: DAK2 domain-containing protein [Desulfitobacteriaceae bacterium]|nr:DAK2 domain-containing protein [Desulfitobacteriaceae bacterium]